MTLPDTFVIIHNPTAGSGRGSRTADAVAAALQNYKSHGDRELNVTTHPTSAPGDAEKIAENAIQNHTGKSSNCANPPICIVACGGDGTVQDIANAIVNTTHSGNAGKTGTASHTNTPRAILGLAPAGRCNDFARALKIPTDSDKIAQILTEGTPRPIDLGCVTTDGVTSGCVTTGGDSPGSVPPGNSPPAQSTHRYFCTIAALGFDAAVSRYVNDMWMPLRGTPAYIYGTLQTLLRYKTPTLKLSGDFGDYEGPVFFAANANTPSYGGAMRIAPEADPTDGNLDICLVTKISRLRALRLLPSVMSATHPSRPQVRMLRTKTLTVTHLDAHLASPTNPDKPIEVWADGEPIATVPVTIRCVPGAIKIMLP